MRKSAVPLFKGKTKTQVTHEAFQQLGLDASREHVNAYAKKNYGIHKPIESSMYYTVKGQLKREVAEQSPPVQPAIPQPQVNKKDFWAVLRQVKALADEVGGTERLQELAELSKGLRVDRLSAFAESYK